MHMRSFVLASVLLAGTLAHAAEIVETTKETTTTYHGTVSQVVPGTSTIVMQSAGAAGDAPQQYAFTEKTTFVDSAGNVVSRETITNKPVTLYYTKEGDRSVVSKVVVENSDGSVTEKRTETHTEIR
jgi:hypothetical protein